MTLKRVWIYSPNYSGGNSGRRLLVLHTTEGAQTYQDLGAFFANPSSQVSSHVGIDDTLGTIGEYVKRSNSAWTAGNANTVAIQAEFCTPSGAAANWSESTWKNQHHNMLRNAADWLAEESAATGIPLVGLTPGQAQGNGRGVCQHSDLGAWGGGHYDCGNGFPIGYVIDLAKGGAPTAPTSGGTVKMSNITIPAGTGKTDVAIPSGAARIRLYGSDDSGGATWQVTLDWRGGGTGENPDASANGDKVSDWAIPPSVKAVRIKRRDTGNFPISVSFG